LLPSFPRGVVELVVLHPYTERSFEWADIPPEIKRHAEMRFHGPIDDHLYATYGINPEVGAIAAVRPDGYVGLVSSLQDVSKVDEYLERCLVKVS
jgi:phenol 2-monooxygenase (NADPH)